jgi:hypothetical protein
MKATAGFVVHGECKQLWKTLESVEFVARLFLFTSLCNRLNEVEYTSKYKICFTKIFYH